MTREEMLSKLRALPFALIDPSSDWEDIGFTERPIWVNSKGYGYIMCDEPCSTYEVEGVSLEKWNTIHSKLTARTLLLEDIEGTSLVELLDEITNNCFSEGSDALSEVLSGLTALPVDEIDRIYGLETYDGWQFFSTVEAFNNAFERDWCDFAWDELSDTILKEWLDRLSVEKDPNLISWATKHNLPQENDDEPHELVETGEYESFWAAHNTKEFRFWCSTVVFDGKNKRYVSLIAENDSKTNKPQTVFKITSTHQDLIGTFIVAGCADVGSSIASDDELGKWCTIKNKMFPRLLDLVVAVTGNDPYARSLELFLAVKEALNTNLLDQLIEEYAHQ